MALCKDFCPSVVSNEVVACPQAAGRLQTMLSQLAFTDLHWDKALYFELNEIAFPNTAMISSSNILSELTMNLTAAFLERLLKSHRHVSAARPLPSKYPSVYVYSSIISTISHQRCAVHHRHSDLPWSLKRHTSTTSINHSLYTQRPHRHFFTHHARMLVFVAQRTY